MNPPRRSNRTGCTSRLTGPFTSLSGPGICNRTSSIHALISQCSQSVPPWYRLLMPPRPCPSIAQCFCTVRPLQHSLEQIAIPFEIHPYSTFSNSHPLEHFYVFVQIHQSRHRSNCHLLTCPVIPRPYTRLSPYWHRSLLLDLDTSSLPL